jgi:hypothetical protein
MSLTILITKKLLPLISALHWKILIPMHSLSQSRQSPARGMTQLTKDSGLGRESLYKALSPGAKPRYETAMKVVRALGGNLHAEVRHG